MRVRTILAAAALAALSLLPGAGAALAQTDRDCEDFPTRVAAQRVLDANPSDPERLDRDDDMLACEDRPGGDGTAPGTQPDVTQPDVEPASPGATDSDDGQAPAGPIEAGGGGTATSGDDSLPLLGAGLGGLAVGGVLVAGRRALRSRR